MGRTGRLPFSVRSKLYPRSPWALVDWRPVYFVLAKESFPDTLTENPRLPWPTWLPRMYPKQPFLTHHVDYSYQPPPQTSNSVTKALRHFLGVDSSFQRERSVGCSCILYKLWVTTIPAVLWIIGSATHLFKIVWPTINKRILAVCNMLFTGTKLNAVRAHHVMLLPVINYPCWCFSSNIPLHSVFSEPNTVLKTL